MLHASQLPKFQWGEAMKHTIYLKNQTSTKALNGITPYEAFYGTKPNIVGLHEFGNKVWVRTTAGSKLDGRLEIGRWVVFDEMSDGHQIYWPEKHSVSIERSVKFDSDADIFMPTSVLLKGEQVVLKVTPEGMGKPEQPTVLFPPVDRLTTSFVDNPVIDHLGDNFKHTTLDQG